MIILLKLSVDYAKTATGKTADELVSVSQDRDKYGNGNTTIFLINCILLDRQITAVWWNNEISDSQNLVLRMRINFF